MNSEDIANMAVRFQLPNVSVDIAAECWTPHPDFPEITGTAVWLIVFGLGVLYVSNSEGRSLDGFELFAVGFTTYIIGWVIVINLEGFGLIKFEEGGKLTETEKKRLEGLQSYTIGEDHYLSKEYGKAVEHLNRAIELDYMRDTAYEFRSVCHEELGSLKKATEDLNSAISLRPNDANLYFQRSNIRNKGKDFQGSVTDLQEAIRLSKLDNETNEKYRQIAQELGHKDHTSMYEASLHMAKLKIWRECTRKTDK